MTIETLGLLVAAVALAVVVVVVVQIRDRRQTRSTIEQMLIERLRAFDHVPDRAPGDRDGDS